MDEYIPKTELEKIGIKDYNSVTYVKNELMYNISDIVYVINLDEKIKNKTAGMLTGIPYAVKDAICTKDWRSTGGAKILNDYIPP